MEERIKLAIRELTKVYQEELKKLEFLKEHNFTFEHKAQHKICETIGDIIDYLHRVADANVPENELIMKMILISF